MIVFFPLKLHFSRTIDDIIARGAVLESLEYDMFGSEMLRVKPTVNTNDSLLKVEDTTLTEMKTKPVFSKRRIKSKFKSKPLTEVRSTGSKHKYKITIAKTPQKTKTKIR